MTYGLFVQSMGGSPGDVSEEPLTWEKRKKGWRTSRALLILQLFRHFTYVTAHFPTLPSLYLRYSSFFNPSVASFSNPSFASTSQALHLRHLANRPWYKLMTYQWVNYPLYKIYRIIPFWVSTYIQGKFIIV